MASTTISTSSAVIITLLTRSRPLRSPMLHTSTPAATVMAIHRPISTGSASISVKTLALASLLMPWVKVPVANLKK